MPRNRATAKKAGTAFETLVAGLVVAKGCGRGQPGDQIVLLTLRDLVSLLTGERPEEAG